VQFKLLDRDPNGDHVKVSEPSEGNFGGPLSGSHNAIVRPRPRSDVHLRNSGPRETGTLIRNRRGIFSRILIECHGLPLLNSESGEDSNGVRLTLFHGAQKEDLTSGGFSVVRLRDHREWPKIKF
jgi:hypothetical protein